MRYYYDMEFLEGKQDKKFSGIKYGETKPTIDVISVGFISEDNREYYAISKGFNLKEAWNRYQDKKVILHDAECYIEKEYWIRDNVLKPIYLELSEKYFNTNFNYDEHYKFTYSSLKYLINKYGKTNKEIANDIIKFTKPYQHNKGESNVNYSNIEFYGYYSAYDHVALCQLFGTMDELPAGFPTYSFDLKQESDRIYKLKKEEYMKNGGKNFINKLSNHQDYPKQNNEHNALSDALFNKNLHEFLNTLL